MAALVFVAVPDPVGFRQKKSDPEGKIRIHMERSRPWTEKAISGRKELDLEGKNRIWTENIGIGRKKKQYLNGKTRSFNILYCFFLHTIYYNIENWVWTCWSYRPGLELSLPCSCLIGGHCPPRVAIHSRSTIVRTWKSMNPFGRGRYTSNHPTVLPSL